MYRSLQPTERRPAWRFAVLLVVGVAVALASLGIARPAKAGGASVTSTTVMEGDSGTRTATVTASWSVTTLTLITITVAPVWPATSADITPSTTSFYDLGSGSQAVSVSVIGDLIREPNQVATVTLHLGGATGSSAQGTVTVIDDDHPTVSIADRTMLEDGSADNANVFTVALSKAIANSTQLHVQTASGTATAGSDFLTVNTDITIPASALSATVTVPIVADNVIELNSLETFTVTVSALNAGDITVNGSDLVAVGRISDDDLNGNQAASAIFQLGSDAVAGTSLFAWCRADLPVGEPFIDPADVQMRITLDHASTRPFEFNLFTTGSSKGTNATAGSDFQAQDRVLVFPANTRTMTFNVRIFDDGITEGDEYFQLRATDGLIANTQPCEQNVFGGVGDVKIGWNLY